MITMENNGAENHIAPPMPPTIAQIRFAYTMRVKPRGFAVWYGYCLTSL
jgi:hypothetical protein